MMAECILLGGGLSAHAVDLPAEQRQAVFTLCDVGDAAEQPAKLLLYERIHNTDLFKWKATYSRTEIATASEEQLRDTIERVEAQKRAMALPQIKAE